MATHRENKPVHEQDVPIDERLERWVKGEAGDWVNSGKKEGDDPACKETRPQKPELWPRSKRLRTSALDPHPDPNPDGGEGVRGRARGDHREATASRKQEKTLLEIGEVR